jgi:glycosyltransferase involved in cell wall biosynthesis
MSLLTIVIPHYNRLPYLSLCLKSVGNSIGKNWDKTNIVVFDDCSYINEINKVISDFIAEFPEVSIKLIHNKSKQGIAKAIVESVSFSDSKYTWVVGSDDLLDPKAIEYLLEVIINLEPDLIVVNKNNFDVSSLNIDSNFTSFQSNSLVSYREVVKRIFNPIGDISFRIVDSLCDLIDSKYGNVFLGAIMVNIFRTELWKSYDFTAYDYSGFKDLHSTYPQIPVFSDLFTNTNNVYIYNPLIYVGDGIRDWATNGDFSLLNSKGDYLLQINISNEILKTYLYCGMKIIKYYRLLGDISFNAGYFSFLYVFATRFKGQKVFNQNYINLTRSFSLNFIQPLYYYGLIRGFIKLLHLGSKKWIS